MDTELENEESTAAFGKKRKRSWQRKVLRWTWIIVSTVVWITFQIAVGVLWVMLAMVVGFIGGILSFDSAKAFREMRRAKGDYSQG